MNKHAYLIIAHNQFSFLKKLILELDYVMNDIFVLIDKKSNFDKEKFKNITKYSKLTIISNVEIFWGGYSQIKAELTILKLAYSDEYSYYHLISGSDFPILNNEDIYSYFESSNNTEFLEVCKHNENKLIEERYLYHYYFQDTGSIFLKTINRLLVKAQKILNLKRKVPTQIYKGANWFSITHNFVSYLLKNENFIEKTFKNTLCCDEVFMQTVLMNSQFKMNLVSQSYLAPNKRYVVWEDANLKSPKILTLSDYDNIIKSNCFFIRKCHEQLSLELVDKLILRKGINNE